MANYLGIVYDRSKGNYTISAVVDTLPGETYALDNIITGGTISVAAPGDINTDGAVDIFYAVRIAIDRLQR